MALPPYAAMGIRASLLLAGQDFYFPGGEGLAMGGGSEGRAPDEAGAGGPWGIGGEGEEGVAAGAAAAGGAVLDPEQGPGKIREAVVEVVPDHLRRQIFGHLRDEPAGAHFLADDHGCVARLAPVDPDPAAVGPEAVSAPLVDVLGRKVHLLPPMGCLAPGSEQRAFPLPRDARVEFGRLVGAGTPCQCIADGIGERPEG